MSLTKEQINKIRMMQEDIEQAAVNLRLAQMSHARVSAEFNDYVRALEAK